jgi:exonuclease VII small subunit
MWPIAPRRRRAVSPPFFNSYDSLDLYPGYPSYDAIASVYPYNYGLGYGLGSNKYTSTTEHIEMATRNHFTAQKDYEKAKEKFEEAEKKMKECEAKMKQAEEILQQAKSAANYAS